MLSALELELLQAENHQKAGVYDRVKDILIPGVGTLGTIVSIILDRPAGVTWLIASLTVVLTGFSVYPKVVSSIRRRTENAANENAAGHYLPQLREFVQRYGAFVESRTSDTLHYMVGNNLADPHRSELLKRLGTPNIGLWNTRWVFFSRRLNRLQPSFIELRSSAEEFHSMVAEFNNLCVAPIFEYLPDGLRSGLSDRDKSMLNGFQQTFAGFLDDYMEFGRRLAESRPALEGLHYYLARPKPL